MYIQTYHTGRDIDHENERDKNAIYFNCSLWSFWQYTCTVIVLFYASRNSLMYLLETI